MMGLYLAVFKDDEELNGLEVGGYSDFGFFRDTVVAIVENGVPGSRCPTLILHSDCDGQWTPSHAVALERELRLVTTRFRECPPVPLNSHWQRLVAGTFGIRPQSLYDCFFDVDGEPLLERLISLARLSQDTNLPIQFQ
jgi:hypothetical protein